jgi:hypothetical protein
MVGKQSYKKAKNSQENYRSKNVKIMKNKNLSPTGLLRLVGLIVLAGGIWGCGGGDGKPSPTPTPTVTTQTFTRNYNGIDNLGIATTPGSTFAVFRFNQTVTSSGFNQDSSVKLKIQNVTSRNLRVNYKINVQLNQVSWNYDNSTVISANKEIEIGEISKQYIRVDTANIIIGGDIKAL